MAKRNIFAVLTREVEAALSLDDGTVSKVLLDRSDWSFLIKTQVMMEALLEKAIREVLGRPELEGILGPQLNASTLADMAKALNILSARESEICKSFAAIRNKFAHRVRYFDKSLSDYAGDLKDADLAKLVNLMEGRQGQWKLQDNRHADELRRKRAQLRDILGQEIYMVLVTLAMAAYEGSQRAQLQRRAVEAAEQMPSMMQSVAMGGLPPRKS